MAHASVVLITGMSGAGKSTVLAELERRGHRAVDTDYDGWSVEEPEPDGGFRQLWREDRIDRLLDDHADGTLFISGTVENQGRFYPRFAAVVLLTAPPEVLLARVADRPGKTYGKSDRDRALIAEHIRTVEPLLRATATIEIDTRRPIAEIADRLEQIADGSTAR